MPKSQSSKSKAKTKKNAKPTKRSFVKRWWVGSFFLLGALLAWFWVVYASIFAKTNHSAKNLTINQGDTYHAVLVDKPWQTHKLALPQVAKAYLKLATKKPLQTGVYPIPANASLAETLTILEQGAKVSMLKVQIIEGKTIKDLYHAIKTTEGVTLTLLSPSAGNYTWEDVKLDNQKVANALNISTANGNLEGLFAPDTYYFARGVSDETILRTLYDRQRSLVEKAWQTKKQGLPYRSADELLIMASIIERETGVADERDKVAAVFVNRLKKGMRLQTDPTIIYGLFDRYDGTIYRSNIAEKTAYNTYQIDGLPPTPIALPSVKSLEAAANPADTDVLFFVATGEGGHTFSRTLDEHNRAVAVYRERMSKP